MSDFVFSSDAQQLDALRRLYDGYFDPAVSGTCIARAGDWGCLVASDNRFAGLAPWEDDDGIIVIAGGPLIDLPDQERYTGRSRYTRRLLDEVRDDDACDWFTAASGAFAACIVDKRTGRVRIVTDIAGLLPVFTAGSGTARVVGSRLTPVAHAAPGGAELDPAAVGEFTLHGPVTFPYTLYRGVTQLAPGSVFTLASGGDVAQRVYWQPREDNPYATLGEAARALRDGFRDDLARICAGKERIALFLSGGEDSRTVLRSVPDGVRVDCFTLTDSLNREARLAGRIARACGQPWHFLQRSPDHYLKDLKYIGRYIGHECSIDKLHFVGLPAEADLAAYDAVLGGLLSDFYLKGARAKFIHRRFRGFSLWPSRPRPVTASDVYAGTEEQIFAMSRFLSDDIVREIHARKMAHVAYVRTLRPSSVAEWWWMWPASQTASTEQHNGDRRCFRAYEPFTLNNIIAVSAAVPLAWKANRALFHRAFAGVNGRLGWIPHPDGWLPALGIRGNILAGFLIGGARVARKALPGAGSRNEYSWPLWAELVRRPVFDQLRDELADGFGDLAGCFRQDLATLLNPAGLEATQQMRLLQALDCLRDARTGPAVGLAS